MALRSRVKSFTLGLKIITEGVMRRAMIYDFSEYKIFFAVDSDREEPEVFNWDPPVPEPPEQEQEGGEE